MLDLYFIDWNIERDELLKCGHHASHASSRASNKVNALAQLTSSLNEACKLQLVCHFNYCPGVAFFSSALLCQQGYCHGACVRRRRHSSSVKLVFSETIKPINAMFVERYAYTISPDHFDPWVYICLTVSAEQMEWRRRPSLPVFYSFLFRHDFLCLQQASHVQ